MQKKLGCRAAVACIRDPEYIGTLQGSLEGVDIKTLISSVAETLNNIGSGLSLVGLCGIREY
ncbi:MAG: hypothetical protein ACOWWR_01760 [Eubacteriales bacterium]